MKSLGRILGATFVIALLAGPAWSQNPVPKYGDPDKVKTPADIAAEKEAERAYRRSLGNIPAKTPPAKPKAKAAEGGAK